MRQGGDVSAPRLSKLLDAVYEAGTDSDQWSDALSELSSVFEADECSLARHNVRDGSVEQLFSVPGRAAERPGSGSDIVRSNPQTSVADEASYRVTGSAFRPRRSAPEYELPRSGRRKSRPEPRDPFHDIRLVLDRRGADAFYISVGRSRQGGDFDNRDLVVLEALFPHLRRAFQAWLSHVKVRARENAAMRAMNALAIGVLIVDENSQVLYRNAAAGEILADAGASPDGDSALELSAHERLKDLSTNVGRLSRRGRTAEAPRSFSITRRSGNRPFSAFVVPLYQEELLPFRDRPAAVVYFCDPDSKPRTDWAHLCGLYGLTRTEAKVAGRLAQGERVDQIRKTLSVSDNTIRTHIKHILQKTNTRRQADLVRLLAAGPAQLRL